MADQDYFAPVARPARASVRGRRGQVKVARLLLSVAAAAGLLAVRVHPPEALTSLGRSALTQPLMPPVGVEETGRPLGSPPAELALPEGTSYRFLYTQSDGVTPVTWSPCRPIHYVTRPDNAPPGADQLMHEAFAEVSRATGLRFVDDGPTTENPSAERAPYQPDRYGKRWAPVLVAWAGADEVPDFGASAIGEAGALPVRSRSGDKAFVTGMVNLDFAKMSAVGARGRYGETRGVVLHELGHLVGLDHVDDPVQVMYPSDGYLAGAYAMGDRAGLAALGRGACQPDI